MPYTSSPQLFRYNAQYFNYYINDGFYPGLLKKLEGVGLREELRIDAAKFGRPEQTPAKLDELIMYAMSRIHQQPDNILDAMSPGGAAENPLTKDLQRLATALKSEMDIMLDEEIAIRSGGKARRPWVHYLQRMLPADSARGV